MNVIEAAEKAGIDMSLWNMGAGSLAFVEGVHGIPRSELERFAQIIRNQALEDALAEVEQGIWFDKTTDQILVSIADAIRSMKKDQP